jgi:UDP-glucuronate decarboxylase
MRLMESEPAPGAPVNLGNPNELTVSDLVQRVLALTGSRSELVHMPLPVDDPRRRRPDIARAEAILGWTPKVDLQTGLEATATWFTDELRRATPRRESRSAAREVFTGVAAE